MATECTQETVLNFLTASGGRVRNAELSDHFRAVIQKDPVGKPIAREAFKRYVDNVAYVKTENGVKYVCLKKKFRGCSKRSEDDSACGSHAPPDSACAIVAPSSFNKRPSVENQDNNIALSQHTKSCEEGTSSHAAPQIIVRDSSEGSMGCSETAENDEAKQEILPDSGYGTDKRGVENPQETAENISNSATVTSAPEFLEREAEMGGSITRALDHKTLKGPEDSSNVQCLQICKQPSNDRRRPVPEIAVIEASPLPVVADGTVFNLPQPAGQCLRESDQSLGDEEGDVEKSLRENSTGKATQCVRRRTSRGSQRSLLSNNPSEEGADEGQIDSMSMGGSDSSTPRGSRKTFIELMMNSSPQVRRSMVLRHSIYQSVRSRDSTRSDSDSASVVSSNPDEESAAVALDPLEHEWMMCASDGEWDSLHRLLVNDPNLLTKKDFVTGFTCFHWAAKLGNQELMALLVNFAKKHEMVININTRSSAGYTPLHLAAMHNHVEVVKLLVGAYEADVDARDYNGKKACQYLKNCAAQDIFDIVGGAVCSDRENTDCGETVRWRLSKVLQPNLKPLKLLTHSTSENDVCDSAASVRPKLLRRKSSLSKMKPRLHKIRFRTQIVHSTSLFEKFDKDGSSETPKSPLRSRPLSNLFG